MAKARKGPASIFHDKVAKIGGRISKVGSAGFEASRKRLAKLAGQESASDGDTVEYLARGHENTRRYLRK